MELNQRAQTQSWIPQDHGVYWSEGFLPCATKAEDALLQAKPKKIGILLLKSANFFSLTREMKEIAQFLERESKKQLQCPRQQC